MARVLFPLPSEKTTDDVCCGSCCNAQMSGLLDLEVTTTARAICLSTRFFGVHAVGVYNIKAIASACILLAVKSQVGHT